MTTEEFKAWFSGFSENIRGIPTMGQWQRVQEMIERIDEKKTPVPMNIPNEVRVPQVTVGGYVPMTLTNQNQNSFFDFGNAVASTFYTCDQLVTLGAEEAKSLS